MVTVGCSSRKGVAALLGVPKSNSVRSTEPEVRLAKLCTQGDWSLFLDLGVSEEKKLSEMTELFQGRIAVMTDDDVVEQLDIE
jgi:hypothetical protein